MNGRRIGMVEVTELQRVPAGGVDVVLARAGHPENGTRVVLHFHVAFIAEEFYPVGQRFDLILEPVARP